MFLLRFIKSLKSSLAASAAVAFAQLFALGPRALAQQPITLPLSPTSLNVFNFGPHSFKVQYPSGTSFSDIDMTVAAEQISQQEFASRVAGTQFSRAACDVYQSENGNCIDYIVSCSKAENHQATPCPSTAKDDISVETSFNSDQSIVNPGLLTTPKNENSWSNILDAFYVMRIDPTAHGHTNGFSEFVAVALNATNPEGLANFAFEAPLRSGDPRSFPDGSAIPIDFTLTSAAHPGQPVTDASAGLTVLMVANAQNQPVSNAVFAQQIAFTYEGGAYRFNLWTTRFAKGTYVLTVFGDAFASQATVFTLR